MKSSASKKATVVAAPFQPPTAVPEGRENRAVITKEAVVDGIPVPPASKSGQKPAASKKKPKEKKRCMCC